MNASINHEEDLRIVSLLPSATEMAYALGLGERLLGVSHGCDYPPDTARKAVVVHSALGEESLSLSEVDARVREKLRAGESLYLLDTETIARLNPNLILTQDLCQVCAPAGNEVRRLLQSLPDQPRVEFMSPHTIADIERDFRQLAAATGTQSNGERQIQEWRERLDRISKSVSRRPTTPRVVCVEWIDPPYCAGHWVPEMVEIAGGWDPLGRKGENSVAIRWEQILEADPDLLVILPCGYALRESIQQAEAFVRHPQAKLLRAARDGKVFAVDAAYFSRPGPRVIDGTELLGHLLHPDLVPWSGRNDAYAPIAAGL